MSRRRSIAAWIFSVLAFASLSAFADEAPTLVKLRLQGGRTIVGELVAVTRAGIRLTASRTES